MSIATVSSKGQVTLPARARREIGIEPHDRVVIDVEGDHILVRPVRDLMEFAGFLGKAKSVGKERAGMIKAVSGHVEKRP